ncbi:hypothetical protein LR48_Vigan02g087200 [Vigna angularis]|uniref:Uncharacterized protein n=1 Tax=Phaseolus angularis TaxID=3914 RepID=A0A0L9TWD4_PHAAN|nr:hypothetical protein LR48_Vigan02g087200 [Vigna angularis]
MAAASNRTRKVPPSERNASPSGWISDRTARERFMSWKILKDVAQHKSIELSLFRNEGFIFLEKLEHQGLSTFVQMKGDCYPELVGVFYNNIKVVDGNIHSRIKGVDIVINNDTWLQVAVFKKHIIDVGNNDGCNLPYGVFISKILSLSEIALTSETKITCTRNNQIGKVTLTCIGLKKTALGCIFSDVQNSTNDQDIPDSDSEQILLSPKSEFEKFVVNKFEKVSKRTSMMKKSLMGMNEKMDEIIKNYVESSTSTEGSTDEVVESSETD